MEAHICAGDLSHINNLDLNLPIVFGRHFVFQNYPWEILGQGHKCQPSGAGGTRSPPATPHRLHHLTASLIQNVRQGLEIGQTFGY